ATLAVARILAEDSHLHDNKGLNDTADLAAYHQTVLNAVQLLEKMEGMTDVVTYRRLITEILQVRWSDVKSAIQVLGNDAQIRSRHHNLNPFHDWLLEAALNLRKPQLTLVCEGI